MGTFDIRELVPFEGVFAPLADEQEIAKLRVDKEGGTIFWPNGADIAPEVLYEHIKQGRGKADPEANQHVRSP